MRDDRQAWQPRHPAYRGLVERAVQEAQDRQAMDAAHGELVEVDAFMGGPAVVPESAEVRRHRAVVCPPRDVLRAELAETVRAVREWDGWPYAQVAFKAAVVVLAVWMVVMIVGLTLVAGYFGQVHGGWPA